MQFFFKQLMGSGFKSHDHPPCWFPSSRTTQTRNPSAAPVQAAPAIGSKHLRRQLRSRRSSLRDDGNRWKETTPATFLLLRVGLPVHWQKFFSGDFLPSYCLLFRRLLFLYSRCRSAPSLAASFLRFLQLPAIVFSISGELQSVFR